MNSRKILLVVVPVLLIIFSYACNHDPDPPTDPIVNTGPDDPLDSICFSGQIQPILISNCAKSGCHDDTTRQSGVILNTYANIKATISGSLLLYVIQDPGQLGMPAFPYNKLDSSQIALIQQWVNEGMQNNVDCDGVCDTNVVTFSGTIFPLVQSNCLGCHTEGTYPLTNYTNIKTQVDNGNLFCAVNHNAGCLPMPQGTAQLPTCKLDQIRIWIDQGAPNN